MKYKLYQQDNNIQNIIGHVLYNRGIDNWKEYLDLDESCVQDYNALDNIAEAVECLVRHLNCHSNIGILVDCDPDGYCSASMMYSYIKRCDSNIKIEYILHRKAKSHGLNFDDDITIPENIQLLVIPDAGTNDVEQCKSINEQGIEILILDHHEKEFDNPYAIIVNNQMSDNYINKNLCGAGIVYRFLQALDDYYWQEYADDYLDLCALANISDVMDIRSFETKYLITKGLNNIQNKCFLAFLQAQSYSTKDIVNIHNIQWYITPVLNAMIRVGDFEEKELLFKAFIENDEFFDYKTKSKKDKSSEVIQEDIYTRAARLSKNAKARQDKNKTKAVEAIIELADKLPQSNKVIMLDVTDYLDEGLTGVVAIKIAENYNKPCILVKKHFKKDENKYVFGGSARNVNNSPIDSFKDIVNSNSAFNFGIGHNSAFGVELNDDKLYEANIQFNRLLSNIDYDNTYTVDFIINESEIDFGALNDLTSLVNFTGQGIDDPKIAIENLHIKRSDLQLIGKDEDTISFEINGIKFIQFKCSNKNGLFNWANQTWNDEDVVIINLVGRPEINDYQGLKMLQVNLLDNQVIGQCENQQLNDDDDEW